MFHHIVHANDGSENSLTALRTAIELAAVADTGLDVLFVEDIAPRTGMIADVTAHETEDAAISAGTRRSPSGSRRDRVSR